jgi:hypothetical protein
MCLVCYPVFERVFRLPPEKDVRAASANLMAYSNRPNKPYPGFGGLADTEIKRLLRIKS